MAFSFGAIRRFVLATLILGVLYLATRLFNLTILPIFTDEAIYIRWSQIGSRDAEWRFISLVDGKQPMFTWIMMGLLRFIQDPLIAGRMVSVIAGFISAIGLWILSFELFKSKKVSFTTVALYIISPFALMYDRLAMYDSLVAAFSIWSLYLGILLVRHIRLDVALLLGMCLGAGMLNKTSGFLSLYLLPLTLVLFDWRTKDRKTRFLRWVGLVIVAALLSQVIYAILRLSPLFAMVGQKDLVFVYSLTELLASPFKFLVGNIRGLFDWLTHYLTWPVFISALVPLFWFKNKWRETVLLAAWWFVPFVGLAQFGRVLYPRFILFMSMPLLILAARVLVHLIWTKRTLMTYVLIAVICVPSILSSYFILTNPLYAPIPFSDKSQLIDDWPSGWGVSEVNAFITKESQTQDIAVYTEGTFGLFPYAIEMYQVDNPRVVVKGLWPVPQEMPEEIENIANEKPTYIVFNQTQAIPPWPLTLISEYQKGNRKDVFMRLYRITPETKENLRRP
jgi:4-amino-4-deoxy-L-arabinose transferase-like glycosyltransferase